MDRFEWTDGLLLPVEHLVVQQNGVRIYDGEDKTSFENGKLILTSHRIIWRHHKDHKCVLAMQLSYVIFAEEQAAGFTKSSKVILHLCTTPPNKPKGPITSSPNQYVRFSFKEGGGIEFYRCLTEELSRKSWEHAPVVAAAKQTSQVRHAGIMGIEKKLEQKHKQTDHTISQSFQDLSKLMDKAKEMVRLSKSISAQIKDKKGDITEDETVRFKSYLLSLGIDDPVTRETHGSGDKYYKELARQISTALEQPLQECGGMMTLTDVYCRLNRARGMELLSPDDLINACKLMQGLNLKARLHVFDSGVMVLQLQSHNENQIIAQTRKTVEESNSLTAEELSQLTGISVVLSKERLLVTEKAGKLCRDETEEGLRFYPNLFLTRPVT